MILKKKWRKYCETPLEWEPHTQELSLPRPASSHLSPSSGCSPTGYRTRYLALLYFPVPSYREDVSIDLPTLPKRSRSNSSAWGSYVARPLDELKEATDEERIHALEAAEAIQSNLKSSNPSFIKSMVRSHVYSCFWLGLPSKFCEEHLPKTVYDMILEDDNGSEYGAVYLGKRSGLSGGWRAFALEHKLDDGDALVFELIEPARFKISIVRAFPDSIEEDGKEILEEGNMRATKVTKAAGKLKSASNKTQKPKQAIVHEANEPTSSEGHLPDNSISKKVKLQGVNQSKKTKVSQKKLQKKTKLPSADEPEKETQVIEGNISATEKPKAAVQHKSQANKRRKSQDVQKEIFVQHASSELKKVEPVKEESSELKKLEPLKEESKRISQKPRRKPAPKLFRKKSYD